MFMQVYTYFSSNSIIGGLQAAILKGSIYIAQ